MPQMNGVEAIANIKRRFPEIKSIVLTFQKQKSMSGRHSAPVRRVMC